MGRGRVTLMVVALLMVSIGGAVLIVWQAKAHGIPHFYVLGPSMVLLGIAFTVMNLGIRDEFLRQHFSNEENANRIRQMWRSGWVGILLGVAMIACQYFLGGGLGRF